MSRDAIGAGGHDGHNLYRGTESGTGASGDPLASGLTETSYVDSSPENGTTSYHVAASYHVVISYYVVTAVDTAHNEREPSGEVKKMPSSDLPDRPWEAGWKAIPSSQLEERTGTTERIKNHRYRYGCCPLPPPALSADEVGTVCFNTCI